MGNLDKISGQIVHPPMEDDVGENEEEPIQNVNTKELKIDGCNYEISKPEIRKWIEMSEIDEVALPSDQ